MIRAERETQLYVVLTFSKKFYRDKCEDMFTIVKDRDNVIEFIDISESLFWKGKKKPQLILLAILRLNPALAHFQSADALKLYLLEVTLRGILPYFQSLKHLTQIKENLAKGFESMNVYESKTYQFGDEQG